MNLSKEQKIITDENLRNVIISAGAGSGKTECLTTFLANVAKKIDLSRIIAMTFTNKAAAELKLRLYDKLAKLDSKQKDKVFSARIGTFHSLLLDILKENTLHLEDLALDSLSNIASDIELAKYKEEAFDKLIKNLDKEDIKLLEFLNNGINPSFKGLKELIENAKDLEEIDFNDYSEKEYLAFLKSNFIEEDAYLLKEHADYYNSLKKVDSLKELEKLLLLKDEDLFKKKNKKDPNHEVFNESRMILLKRLENIKDLYLPNDFYTNSLSQNQELKKIFAKLFKSYRNYYKEIKNNNRQIDFDDIEKACLNLLKKHNEIAEKYKNQFDLICIDEFQDTSSIQFEIIKLIANNNLYIVGDTKQSIYSFRKANPKLMNDLISDKHFSFYELADNYRSNKGIVVFNNFLFTKLFKEGIFKKEYEYYKNQNAKADYPYLIPRLHITNTDEEKDLELSEKYYINATKKDDLAISAKILQLIKEKKERYPGEKIAILFRNNNEKNSLIKILKREKIKFSARSNIGYFNYHPIRVLSDCLNYLISNRKEYLYSLLNALYGYELEALIDVSEDNLPENFIEDMKILNYYLRRFDYTSLFAYLLQINGYYQKLNDTLRASIDLFLYDKNLVKYAPKELIKLIDLAYSKQEKGISLDMEDNDTVELLTMHESKGLSKDHVIIYASATYRDNNNDSYLIYDGINFKYKVGDKLFPGINYLINKKYKKDLLYSEYLRIYYVALTRAKKSLELVCGSIKESQDDYLKKMKKYDSFVSLLIALESQSDRKIVEILYE